MSSKYPRSFHLPWSPGGTNDDKRLASIDALLGVEIVVTEKLDGSNLAYTSTAVYSRSHAGPPAHASFAFAKATHGRLAREISPGITVFCEYCFAIHSIEYASLPEASFVFGVRDDTRDEWWPWELIEEQASALELPTVPVLFQGRVDSERDLRKLTEELAARASVYGGTREGVVVRVARGYPSGDFGKVLGKWVRKDHVQTDDHWAHQQIRPQKIASFTSGATSDD